MAYKALLGIEHLMTGVKLMANPNKDPNPVFTFERESPSIVAVHCDVPFDIYWPVTQSLTSAVETEVKEGRYSQGEVEWYAKMVADAMVDQENRSIWDMQTYTRKVGEYSAPTPQETGGSYGSRYAPGEPSPFPMAVVKAMRAKHGKDADKFLAELRWNRDHWFYNHHNMYVGVEPDGYIHT